VTLHSFRRSSWCKAAYVCTGLALLTAAFVSGCSGASIATHVSAPAAGALDAATSSSTPAATPAPTAAPDAACSPSATLPAQTMNPSGGTLTIPACGPFSGVLAYPSFGGNAGAISATLVSSLRSPAGAPAGTNGHAMLYVTLTLTSSDPSDTSISFAGFVAGGAASCGRIDGPFTNGTTYYTQGEFPFSGGANTQTTPGVAGPDSFQGAGCILDGESLTLGAHNELSIAPPAS
jgi:hypothetical protein